MKWLQNIMRGRYGIDPLGWALLILYLLLAGIARRLQIEVLSNVALLSLFYAYFRILSKNTAKRYQENQVFMRYYSPIQENMRRTIKQTKEGFKYKQFTCPSCRQQLRVPRGKKNITVTCPTCKTKFDGKS